MKKKKKILEGLQRSSTFKPGTLVRECRFYIGGKEKSRRTEYRQGKRSVSRRKESGIDERDRVQERNVGERYRSGSGAEVELSGGAAQPQRHFHSCIVLRRSAPAPGLARQSRSPSGGRRFALLGGIQFFCSSPSLLYKNDTLSPGSQA